MLKVGTYNAIIAPNQYYSPENSDFSSSHKTFKRMMPTFAWEVLEVYSGPPVVAFRVSLSFEPTSTATSTANGLSSGVTGVPWRTITLALMSECSWR
jgi:hypothetical protein